MAKQSETGISWTDETWNPIRGCSRVSEGCRNCYAEGVAARFSGPGQPYEGLAIMGQSGPRWTGKVRLIEKQLNLPVRWMKPRRVFVNSMSDLFHESLAFEEIDRIFDAMALCRQHTFQVLTKRAGRMLEWSKTLRQRRPIPGKGVCTGGSPFCQGEACPNHESDVGWCSSPWPLPNVWLGVSAERQKEADERIPLLLQTPAALHWISAEPLLRPLDLGPSLCPVGAPGHCVDIDGQWWHAPGTCQHCRPGLGWVVVGGESGPGARPMHPDWARSLRNQCAVAGVPYHFKQWGEWAPVGRFQDLRMSDEWCDGEAPVCPLIGDIRGYEALIDSGTWLMQRIGKRAAGCSLDGREWHEFPTIAGGAHA